MQALDDGRGVDVVSPALHADEMRVHLRQPRVGRAMHAGGRGRTC